MNYKLKVIFLGIFVLRKIINKLVETESKFIRTYNRISKPKLK